MTIPYEAPDHALPPVLRDALREAHEGVVARLRIRLNKPVPGNPYGGFPGLNLAEHRAELISARRSLISRWNHENPDYKYVEPPPPEVPKPPTKEEVKAARRRAATPIIDPKVDEYVDKYLKDNHPEHEHEELRGFIEYERSMKYADRMEIHQRILDEGKDPGDLKHRHEHHKANPGPQAPTEEDEVDAQS